MDLTGTHKKILLLIQEKKSQIQIAKELGITRQGVFKHCKWLLKNLYLKKDKRGFLILTELGIVELHDRFTPVPKPTKRLHALGLKYPLRNPLRADQPVREIAYKLEVPYKLLSLKNTDQAILEIGLTARLTTRSLILYAPELYYQRGQPSIVVEAKAKELLDREALKLEARLQDKASFALERLRASDILYSEILSEEVADEHHGLAERAVANNNNSKIVLAKHPFDGKQRLIGDKSKRSFAELEAVHPGFAGEDSDMIDKQFNAVLDGEINLLDINDLKTLTTQNTLLIRQYAKQIELHLAIMKKIDQKLSQRKL